MASDAVGSERVSSIVGYKTTKGNFSNTTPNLPQRVAIIGEANHANQTDLDTAGTEITSAKQAGELYGFGSPIHMAMRILRPVNGGGIGGIPVYVYAQAAASGAGTHKVDVAVSGLATGNATHTLVIAGREDVDGSRYDFQVETGDTVADITAKMADAVNNVLGSPMSANDGTYELELTSKWRGASASGLTVTVEDNDEPIGITYTPAVVQTGVGTPSITAALTSFGTNWNTLVLNTYGTVESIMDALESYNGIPDPTTPTGRFTGTIMRPFIALTGSVADNPSTITDTRLDDVTIAICPAPLSAGHHLEAAANMCLLFARKSQDNPHLDVLDMFYPDMPTPTSIGSMADYESRDSFVKKGCSTVDLVNGKYQVKDFVTTYHPVGEIPPAYRYCRNIMLDLNVYFGYYLLEQQYVVGKTIASNDDLIGVDGVIKPRDWKGIIDSYATSLGLRALITEVSFMQDSIDVDLSTTNPDRLETFFRYKRSAIARIVSTTAEAGFNFGN